MEDIETPRLLLRLISREAIRAGLRGSLVELEQGLAATVPQDLLDEPAVLAHSEAQLAADATYLPWSARGILLKDSMQMVGHIRFHSPPDPAYLHTYARDAVELGYEVFATHRRRGYAREALTALMRWAERSHGVARFVASVSPANQASTNLVLKLGFSRVGDHVDPIDGVEYIYLLDSSS